MMRTMVVPPDEFYFRGGVRIAGGPAVGYFAYNITKQKAEPRIFSLLTEVYEHLHGSAASLQAVCRCGGFPQPVRLCYFRTSVYVPPDGEDAWLAWACLPCHAIVDRLSPPWTASREPR